MLLVICPCCIDAAPAQSIGADTCTMPDSLRPLEIKYFGHPYETGLLDRTARLERLVYGEEKSDKPLNDRIAMLLRSCGYYPANRAVSSRSCASYPRVTVLEQRLLGYSFENQPLGERLDRLEVKLFGKPSESGDLAARVDNIADHPLLDSGWTGEHDQTKQQKFVSIVDQIEAMEMTMFGRIHPDKKLAVRVIKLEENVYGTRLAQTDASATLTTRVSQLLMQVRSRGATNIRSI